MLAALLTVSVCSVAAAAPVQVRFPEGVTHGFLLLRSTTGQIVANGDLLQTGHSGRVESQMDFRFKDGSLQDERVVYSQEHVFTLLAYRLVQHGPAFPEPIDASFDRKLRSYQVTSMDKGREKRRTGTIDLPPDVYSGMTSLILKNLPPKARRASTSSRSLRRRVPSSSTWSPRGTRVYGLASRREAGSDTPSSRSWEQSWALSRP